MQDYFKVTLILCLFGTLREIRPSEPFVTEFLLGEWRNITEEQLNRDVYPVGTYCTLALLVVVFLITDYLRFKPVIVLCGLSGISVYVILIWTTSLEWLQASQFFYGLYMATDVAYLTYIYAKVDPEKYPLVSSYTRIAALTGRALSGIIAQLLTVYDLMDYKQLNYITLTAQILATFWALMLPPVNYSIYFHRKKTVSHSTEPSVLETKYPYHIDDERRTVGSSLSDAFVMILSHVRSAYTRPKVVAWSLMYAAAMALFFQVQFYVQMLWIQIQNETDAPVAYNGFVESIQTVMGALGAFLSPSLRWSLAPALVAALQALATFASAFVPNVFVSYAGYVLTGALYHYVITLASAKIASQLSDDSCFGLIFGINTLVGTALQTVLTLVIIRTLLLSIFWQYYTISGLFLVVAIIWFAGWTVNKFKQNRSVSFDCTTVL